MAIPALLLAPVVKFATAILAHADPAVREKAWKLYLDKRQLRLKDHTKYLVDNVEELLEVLNILVKKKEFQALIKDHKEKFYKAKKKTKSYKDKVFKLL